ncbi:MAG: hypothetical protein KIT83_18875 [Bryobacterales bacterium]|nr:hypothetical protein [Bryobacterales bacterium]
MGPNLPTLPGDPDDSGPPPSAVKVTLSGRSFAFFPPIRHVQHNEWRFVKETWAEMLVENPKTGVELWIPRRQLGAISSVDQPFPIVGLQQELELRAGTVWPYRPKLLEMPRAERKPLPSDASSSGGSQSNGRVPRSAHQGSREENRIAKLVGITLVMAILVMFAVLAVYRGDGIFGNRVILETADQEYLSLGARDDYFAVVKRLGPPKGDRWRGQSKEVAFRVLEYPERSYSVVLFGADQATATYLGALDANWRPIHSVPVGRGIDSTALLRTLPKF